MKRLRIARIALLSFAAIAVSLAHAAEPKNLFCITGGAFDSRDPEKDLFFVWTAQANDSTAVDPSAKTNNDEKNADTGTLSLYRITSHMDLAWRKPSVDQVVDLNWGVRMALPTRMKRPLGKSEVTLASASDEKIKLSTFVDEKNLSGSLTLERGGKVSNFAMHCAYVQIKSN